MIEPEVLFEKLAGMSADEVASFCLEQGVRGDLNLPTSCAIANLFKGLADVVYVSVNPNYMQWQNRSTKLCDDRGLPAGMASFVYNFDHEVYPDLINVQC